MVDRVKLGCYIFQDGLNFGSLRKIALECENLGFHSLWIKDNFTPWLGDWFPDWRARPQKDLLECWTALSALASITKNIRLGAVLVNLYRSPSLLAKMASSLDRISGGRLEFGLSAGWNERECVSYGIPFPSSRKRVAMLEESIQLIKSMWTAKQASFSGEFYKVDSAVCEPKPAQKPHPPIWVGGAGKTAMRIAANHADGWIYGLCSKSEYLRALKELREECRRLGRDWKSIAKAWYGIANQVGPELQDYLDHGVRYFIPNFTHTHSALPMRRFVREVRPLLK